MRHIIVIGAGASGLMAAITAAREGASVTVLEGGEKPGKKLLVTGNGRCNLTNTCQKALEGYRGSTEKFINIVMEQFPVERTMAFFEDLGLLLQSKEGYIYPYVNQASAVLDILLLEARRLHVKIKCCEKVTELSKRKNIWQVKTSSWCYEADAVILSAGSMAAPVTGSDGSGYALAKSQGHPIIPPMEALVPLKVKENWVKKLSGLRMQAQVTLMLDEEQKNREGQLCSKFTESGELQWTEYGISGIVVFQLSRYAVRALAEHRNVTVYVDLMPHICRDALEILLKKRRMDGSLEDFLTGLLPRKAIWVILKSLSFRPSDKASQLGEKQFSVLADQIKSLKLTISGHKGFDAAQVCSGGVDTARIKADTLESKERRGLYFSGELMDVDGKCGGYNLQWAWSSGYVAGYHAAHSVRERENL